MTETHPTADPEAGDDAPAEAADGPGDEVVPLAFDPEAIPDAVGPGATVLVATAGDPTRRATTLALLDAVAAPPDAAFLVTTTESAERTVAAWGALGDADRPAVGVVDTASTRQSVSALHGDPPVVHTPGPGDLERLVVALAELSEPRASLPTAGARHLAVRSLTPVLAAAPTEVVCSVVERVTGLVSGRGRCLLGIDYTAHGEETMTALSGAVDGVLWVSGADGDPALEYQPARRR